MFIELTLSYDIDKKEKIFLNANDIVSIVSKLDGALVTDYTGSVWDVIEPPNYIMKMIENIFY